MRKNVAIIDIDGVLSDYRLGLLYWIRQSVPSLSQKANFHLDKKDSWINAESMGISYVEWLGILEMFRMSGGKQTIPLVENADKLMDICNAAGYEVVLLTSRPIDLYSNIYRDTVEWLRNNGLKYHMLLWSKSKAEMIYKMRLKDKALFAIDDELHHVDDYVKLGIQTYWLNWYKKPVHASELVIEVTCIQDIISDLTKGVSQQ